MQLRFAPALSAGFSKQLRDGMNENSEGVGLASHGGCELTVMRREREDLSRQPGWQLISTDEFLHNLKQKQNTGKNDYINIIIYLIDISIFLVKHQPRSALQQSTAHSV